MAAKANGHSLVIVESPAKARTISKFLGSGFTVEASVGHIRDLPSGKKEVPSKFKDENWAYLGVNVEDRFTPIYIVPTEKKQQVKKLKDQLKQADTLYLATDEDREGEAISWHLAEVLKPNVPIKRLVFHEITKEAIDDALAHTRDIDEGLVRAQETRRILDRLYGYDVSQFLWRKVRRGLSAGRVQSVAIRFIVQRERERMIFVSATWWDLIARFATEKNEEFEATLVSVDDRKVPSGKDFDSLTGKIKNDQLLLMNQAQVHALKERLDGAEFRVTSMEEKPFSTRPAPPFTTSTMQQEANRKLNFTARHTMRIAQSLYENGYITYMRTDSTTLASVAIDAARDLVKSEYGDKYLPDSPRTYQSKVKNAQEAHEAIRPAGHPFRVPASLKGELNNDQFRLFDMIWKRTIASQMVDSKQRRITIKIEGGGALFHVSGKVIDFPGYLRAYVEGSDDPNAELADKENILPQMAVEQLLKCLNLEEKDHTTQPPARYSEAALTRKLEEEGIGRPSTYASIIDTILAREYVFKKGNALVPTWTAFSVVKLMEVHFEKLIDYRFTASMEEYLDEISRGESEWLPYLQKFYHGEESIGPDGNAMGLKEQLEHKLAEVDAREMSRFPVGKPDEGEEIFVRVGRYGPFLEQGERKATLPTDLAPDEVKLDVAIELLETAAKGEEPLGIDPDTQKPVYLKQGRFGPYIQRGTPDDEEKPKNASLMKDMKPEDVTFEVALKLLSLPRTLGEHPESKEPVQAHNGRYGPYVKCEKETRSLGADVSPLDVTLEHALELLKQPKQRRGRGAPKEPLKTFEKKSPVTEEEVKVLDGRYGPYATDGTTNASLPKGVTPEELTFDQALILIAERAAKAPAKKKKKKKKATKKKASKKKAAKKKKKAKKKKAAKKKSS